jgi:hypothetical protein
VSRKEAKMADQKQAVHADILAGQEFKLQKMQLYHSRLSLPRVALV